MGSQLVHELVKKEEKSQIIGENGNFPVIDKINKQINIKKAE